MGDLIYCLRAEHDLRLVLAAAVVCLGGLALAYERLDDALHATERPRRLRRMAFAAGLAALAVWCTHFLAMVGYRPDLELNYRVLPTVASLGVVIGGNLLGLSIARSGDGWPWRVLGAVTAMSGVCAMHFLGMFGVATDRPLQWNYADVAVAVWGGLALAGAAAAATRLKTGRGPAVVGLAVLAICTLHFVAMTGVRTPVASLDPGVSTTQLLTWVAAVFALIIVFGAFGTGMNAWMRVTAMGQLRQAIEAMPNGMAFFDSRDRLMIWNGRYAEMNPETTAHLLRGVRFEELLRLGVRENLYGAALGREEAWIAERLAARAGGNSDFEQQLSDGRWLRVKDRRSAGGGTVTVTNDITAMKRDAIALAEARDAAEAANHAKSQFLANMSHEIRTPLNGVIGLSQALARTDLDANQQQMLDLIQASSHTLKALLSDILDMARVESGRLEIADEAFDLGAAVEEAAHLYAATAREKGLQFFVEIAPEARGWVRGDIVRVKQVLTNLISNAVKFTSHGLVSLTVDRITGADGGSLLRFAVQDTGIGFTAEQKARLFGRFEQADGAITRQYGGSGLGLAICQQLSLMMGGALDCESQLGGGSTFFLTLPYRSAEAPQPVVHAEVVETDHGMIRVLLADDHPTNRRVVELMLAPFDLALTVVENGEEAVAAFRSQPYDLVLMDMQMPVMDGLTATRQIRAHEAAVGLARTPLVMLTANALPEHVADGRAAGADGHLSKPFSAEDLIALVADPQSALRDVTLAAA